MFTLWYFDPIRANNEWNPLKISSCSWRWRQKSVSPLGDWRRRRKRGRPAVHEYLSVVCHTHFRLRTHHHAISIESQWISDRREELKGIANTHETENQWIYHTNRIISIKFRVQMQMSDMSWAYDDILSIVFQRVASNRHKNTTNNSISFKFCVIFGKIFKKKLH